MHVRTQRIQHPDFVAAGEGFGQHVPTNKSSTAGKQDVHIS